MTQILKTSSLEAETVPIRLSRIPS